MPTSTFLGGHCKIKERRQNSVKICGIYYNNVKVMRSKKKTLITLKTTELILQNLDLM